MTQTFLSQGAYINVLKEADVFQWKHHSWGYTSSGGRGDCTGFFELDPYGAYEPRDPSDDMVLREMMARTFNHYSGCFECDDCYNDKTYGLCNWHHGC